MRTKINKELLNSLRQEGKTYQEIIEITGYNSNTIYGYYNRVFGKIDSQNKKPKQSITITQNQKEILFGILMGDSNLQCYKGIYLGRNNHSKKQLNYCKYKQSLLNNITYPVKETVIKVKDKEYETCYFCFKSNTELKYFYDLFYINNKRDVPKDLSLLTPRAMAFWFMDDGSARSGYTISIATCSFSLDGLLRLQKFLLDKYKLETTITKEFKLDFKSESGRKFYNLVKEFIIPEMQYKFKYLNI